MAKKKQHIDDFFKEKLAQNELPLDGTEWSRLEHALEPKRKRRFLWWWLLLPLALFGLWALFNPAFNNASDKDGLETNSHLNKDKDQNQDIPNAEKEVTPSLDSTLSPFEQEHGTDVIQIVEETSSQPTNSATELDGSSANSPRDVLNQREEFETVSQAGNEAVDYSYLVVEAWPKDLLSIAYDATFKPLDSSDLKKALTIVTTPGASNSILPLFIGINMGSNINHQRINSNNEDLIKYRKLNEMNSFAPEVQLDLRTEFKGLSYGAGIGYLRNQQSLGSPYSNNPELRILLYDSIAFVDINKDTTWLPWNYRDSVINTNLSNPTYNYVTIPLSVGKAFTLGDRSSIELTFNLKPQFLLGASGQVASPSLRVDDVSVTALNRFNFSTGLNLSYRYQLMPRWQLQSKIGMNYNLMDMAKDSEIQQHIDIYGLKLGLYYRLK